MDPTVTVIATALIQGAVAGLKPTAEKAIKDAYSGIKQLIADRYNDHQDLIDAVDTLEKNPEDANNQQAIIEAELVKAGATKDPVLLDAANNIHVVGSAQSSKKKVLGKRIKRKLKQVEAVEDEIDRALEPVKRVKLEEQAEILWAEIAELETQMTQIQ